MSDVGDSAALVSPCASSAAAATAERGDTRRTGELTPELAELAEEVAPLRYGRELWNSPTSSSSEGDSAVGGRCCSISEHRVHEVKFLKPFHSECTNGSTLSATGNF